jgi:hypothetical protein
MIHITVHVLVTGGLGGSHQLSHQRWQVGSRAHQRTLRQEAVVAAADVAFCVAVWLHNTAVPRVYLQQPVRSVCVQAGRAHMT